ncbi:MAG: hypothetical protein NTX25_19080 [Proteobacteria bacterium]|nr:hypothetical protein [Pseudomonadota bacterium]
MKNTIIKVAGFLQVWFRTCIQFKANHFVSNNQGASLVELMLSMGLLSIITTMGYQVALRIDTFDAEVSARKQAHNEIDRLLSFIQRDLSLRDLQQPRPLCPTASSLAGCINFFIERFTDQSAQTTDRISFSSSCQAIPVGLRQGLLKNADFNHLSGSSGGVCFRVLHCSEGQYPSISIRHTAHQSAAAYPEQVPDLSKKASSRSIVGLALCAQSSTAHDKLLLEAALPSKDGPLKIETRHILVTLGNIAHVQTLPN